MDAFHLLVHLMCGISPGSAGGRITMSGIDVSYTKHRLPTRPCARISRQFG